MKYEYDDETESKKDKTSKDRIDEIGKMNDESRKSKNRSEHKSSKRHRSRSSSRDRSKKKSSRKKKSRSRSRSRRRSKRSKSRSRSRSRKDKSRRSRSRTKSHKESKRRRSRSHSQSKENVVSKTDELIQKIKTGSMIPTAIGVANLTDDQDPSMKINRELFVGNIPTGIQEATIQNFLNAAMTQTNLTVIPGNPIVHTRMMDGGAVVELRTVEETNNMQSLTGIPFMGISLRIGRPSQYNGPDVPHKSWGEITGEMVIPANTKVVDPTTRPLRELFIGNISNTLQPQDLINFLNEAMKKVEFTVGDGDPVLNARISDKFAFIEVRTVEETNNMLSLTGIPFMGQNLKVGRPSKYTGPHVPSRTWEEVLANKLGSKGNDGIHGGLPTTVVKFEKIITLKDLQDEEELQDIQTDIIEECELFSPVKSCYIPKCLSSSRHKDDMNYPGAGNVYVEFESAEEAAMVLAELHGKTFNDNPINVIFFSADKYHQKNFEEVI